MLKYILAQNFCDKMNQSEEVFGLPNIKSAKKRVLVNQTKAARNKAATEILAISKMIITLIFDSIGGKSILSRYCNG